MAGKKKTNIKKKRWTKDDTELTILALPTAVWFLIFSYLPMFGIIIAFKNYKLSAGHGFIYSLFHSEWCGFDNFKFFIQSNAFTMLLRNTILYNIVFIILGLVIPVTLAIIISQIYSKFKSKVYQTLMFFPHFMSWVFCICIFISRQRNFKPDHYTFWRAEHPVVFQSKILAIDLSCHESLENSRIQHGRLSGKYYRN